MTVINSGKSIDLLCEFYDSDGFSVVPDTLKYTQKDDDTDEVLSVTDVNIDNTFYVIKISVLENTVVENEIRRVIVEWTYNGGTEGDSIVHTYHIEKV